ncbi:MAG: glycosyltransferase [Candidatus Hodarchaeales archaeon]|jgi:hypothetical protein
MKADIIHISGFDTYNTHDSGNYIIFDFLRQLNLDSIMILALQKIKNDKDTFFVPKQDIINTIEKAKLVILHDSLFTHNEIRQLYEKLKCQIIMITQDHSLIASQDCVGNLSYPELSSEEEKAINKKSLEQRQKQFLDLPITIVHGSSYSKKVFEESNIFSNKEYSFIPLPADVPYCSSEKEKARKYLGLRTDKKYILWGTTQPKTERKGKNKFDQCLDMLWNMLSPLQRKEIIILNVGPKAGKFGINSNFDTIFYGYQKTRKDMSLYYRVSTVSVCTTTSDAGPMMISESMCNETPVIAFDRSISCDLCINGETGYLVGNLDIEQMSKSIYKILFEDEIDKMSKKSRKKYLDYHDKDVILEKWISLFKKML